MSGSNLLLQITTEGNIIRKTPINLTGKQNCVHIHSVIYRIDCKIYGEITSDSDTHKLQIDPDRLGEWAAENAMTRNPGRTRAVRSTRTLVKDSLNYFWGDQRIPEASSCKYLGRIIRRDLSWAGQLNYTVQKAWKALHFIKHIL